MYSRSPYETSTDEDTRPSLGRIVFAACGGGGLGAAVGGYVALFATTSFMLDTVQESGNVSGGDIRSGMLTSMAAGAVCGGIIGAMLIGRMSTVPRIRSAAAVIAVLGYFAGAFLLFVLVRFSLMTGHESRQETAADAQRQQADHIAQQQKNYFDQERINNQQLADADAQRQRSMNTPKADLDWADDSKEDFPGLFGNLIYPGATIAEEDGVVNRTYPVAIFTAPQPMSNVVAYYQSITPNGIADNSTNAVYQTEAVRPGDNQRVAITVQNNANYVTIKICIDNSPVSPSSQQASPVAPTSNIATPMNASGSPMDNQTQAQSGGYPVKAAPATAPQQTDQTNGAPNQQPYQALPSTSSGN